MTASDGGKVRLAMILTQVVIVVGVVAWLKLCLPRLEKSRTAAVAAHRSTRIEDFVGTMVVDDHSRPAPQDSGREYARKLRRTPSLDEVEQALGSPQAIF